MAKVSVEQALAKAKSHIKKGETAEAQALYATILQAFPNNKKAQQALATIGGGQRSAAEQGPPQAVIDQLMGLYKQGQLELVVDQTQDLTVQFPKTITLWNMLGASAAQIGKLDQAVQAFEQIISLNPNQANAYFNMGNALKDQGKLEEAIVAYNKALAIKPDYEAALNNVVVALKNLGKTGEKRLKKVLETYNKAQALKTENANSYFSRALALQEQGKLEEAIEAYNKALAIKPDYAEAYNNMGAALADQGKLEEAIEAYNKALAIKPDYAEASHNMSFPLLNSGRLKEGLEKYECRWKTIKTFEKKRKFSKPMWDGKEILKGKKVLLWCEQGVGDTINWSSRLPLIASLAERCTLECPAKLVPLMARSFPNIEVKPEDRNNDEQRNDFDYHLPLGSLYRLFLPEILKESKPDAFLLPFPARIKFWTKRLRSLGQGLYVGVSWKSANMSPQRLPNYAPLADWSPIFTIPGVTFINLQYTDFTDDLIEIQNKFGVTVHNFDDLNHFDDLDDVAALCAALDIVVSTKITVPLISAGVGTATKLANWRQSAWNNILLNPVGPFVDVFERNTWETWDNVFIEIAQDIDKMQNKRHDNSGGN